jgi:hypothetical protein
MRPARAAAAALFAAASLAPDVGAAGQVVDGGEHALILPPAGAGVVPYRNSGYALEFADGGVRVRVDLAPLRSRAPFVLRRATGGGRVAETARAAAAGATTQYEAVSRILSWVKSEIGYELDRAQAQDAESVLRRRTAYCAGTARLSVAMLQAVGIEAREVPGYVFAVAPGAAEVQPGFHRWIEVRYPDRGWVFSDPLASQHYVPATYLRLAAESLEQLPMDGRLLARGGAVAPVDVAPQAPEGVRVRANDDRRNAAALVLSVAGEQTAEATLRGQGIVRRLPVRAGEARFLGLPTGSYELKVLRGGRLAAWKNLVFREPVLAQLEIPAGPALAAAGRGE